MQFENVFGTVKLGNIEPERIMGCSFADIDLVPENVIVSGSGEYVTDYEWVFDFPLPVDYVVYRAIRTYMYSGGKRNALLQYDLYERAGITSEIRNIFDYMESNFQKYVKGSRVTAAELYEDIDDDKCIRCAQCVNHFNSGCYMKKVLAVKRD